MRRRSSLVLACIAFVMPGPLAAQERAMVPVTIDGEQVGLATITYKPPGNEPFPTLIFHHGSTGRGRDQALLERPYDPGALAQWFTARGWAVILPSRRGRGGSELAAMIERPVTCTPKGQDANGRTMALCRVEGRDLGAAMVVSGMALAVTADGGDYVEQEAQATRARVGMHDHACLAPSEWREQRRTGH